MTYDRTYNFGRADMSSCLQLLEDLARSNTSALNIQATSSELHPCLLLRFGRQYLTELQRNTGLITTLNRNPTGVSYRLSCRSSIRQDGFLAYFLTSLCFAELHLYSERNQYLLYPHPEIGTRWQAFDLRESLCNFPDGWPLIPLLGTWKQPPETMQQVTASQDYEQTVEYLLPVQFDFSIVNNPSLAYTQYMLLFSIPDRATACQKRGRCP